MKFSYTHHMPYTDIGEAAQDWPIPNKQFDPEKGVALYREGIVRLNRLEAGCGDP